MFDFGARMKELRKSKGLSQHQVAKKLDVTKSTISGYENNTRFPSFDAIPKIALLYNVSADYLLGINNQKMICVEGLTEPQIDAVRNIISQFLQNQIKNKDF
ncbi:MAG: helix-turn-helix domain-containing protein [Oscillospiraceae bacterium]|nr:helix-turn-helix domain-containing protein [Oscillospiraceae bacterium]